MSERTYTATIKDRVIKITNHELAAFRAAYIGTSEIAARMSELLWFDIYALDAAFGVSPHNILDAIKSVEQPESSVGVKPAAQFRNLPLKGLWHKHYFSAHFVAKNIQLALGRDGLKDLVEEVMDPAKSPVITQEMISELTHRITSEQLEARSSNNKLTGEWIVYAQHMGENYYLCCNTHNSGDQFIYDRIMEHCVRDFPELPTWLETART